MAQLVFKILSISTILLLSSCLQLSSKKIALEIRLRVLSEDPEAIDKDLYNQGRLSLEKKLSVICEEDGYFDYQILLETQRCWWRDDVPEEGKRVVLFSCEAEGLCKK